LFTGVSLLLVIVAQGILTAGLLPICTERLWIDQLTSNSMFWVLAALAESILVAHFFFRETRDSERMLHLASITRAPDEHAIGGYKSRNGIHDEQSQSAEAIDEEEEQEKDTEEYEHHPPRKGLQRRAALRRLPAHASVFQEQTVSWRRKAIRSLDKGCMIAFPVTYIIFVSVMFARRDQFS
jgi:hypothetical protein